MHEKLERYLMDAGEKCTKIDKVIAKRIRERRDELLMSLGLWEGDCREVSILDEYDETVEHENGELTYYRVKNKHAIEVTEEEFRQILATLPVAAQEKYKQDIQRIEASLGRMEKKSGIPQFPEVFCKVIACILWIGGLLASFVLSWVENVYTGTKEVNWSGFFALLVGFLIAGCFALCGSYLFRYFRTMCEYLIQLDRDNH